LSSTQFISYGIKGLLRVAKLGLIDANMDDIVRKRLKILNHWHKFGLASTVDAFGVSKSTLYAWRKSLRQAGGNTVALKPVFCKKFIEQQLGYMYNNLYAFSIQGAICRQLVIQRPEILSRR
jgi:hypothetical protein